MSTLLLVRHGQARAFDADSDRLTERGEAQARRLGEHFVRAGIEFDEVYTGTLVRQRRTATIASEVFRASGRSFPEPSSDPAWNEYDATGILASLLPELAARDAEFAALVAAFQERAAAPDRNRYFQRMFEVLMHAWATGSVENAAVEPFGRFHERVRGAFASITSRGGSRRIAVFTSGGPIGVSVQHALEAPPLSALALNFRVRNASITEFVFSGGRLSLDSFNVDAHLSEELRTYR
jgi:broad specificity phosphatase PhoE